MTEPKRGIWMRETFSRWEASLGSYYAILVTRATQFSLLGYLSWFLSFGITIAVIHAGILVYSVGFPLLIISALWMIAGIYRLGRIGRIIRDDLRQAGYNVEGSSGMRQVKFFDQWIESQGITYEQVREVGESKEHDQHS